MSYSSTEVENCSVLPHWPQLQRKKQKTDSDRQRQRLADKRQTDRRDRQRQDRQRQIDRQVQRLLETPGDYLRLLETT